MTIVAKITPLAVRMMPSMPSIYRLLGTKAMPTTRKIKPKHQGITATHQLKRIRLLSSTNWSITGKTTRRALTSRSHSPNAARCEEWVRAL